MTKSTSAKAVTRKRVATTRRTRNMNNCFTCAMRKLKCKPVTPYLCENCQNAGLDYCLSHVPWKYVRAAQSGFRPGLMTGRPGGEARTYDLQADDHPLFANHIKFLAQQGQILGNPGPNSMMLNVAGITQNQSNYPLLGTASQETFPRPTMPMGEHFAIPTGYTTVPQQNPPHPVPYAQATHLFPQYTPAGPTNDSSSVESGASSSPGSGIVGNSPEDFQSHLGVDPNNAWFNAV